MIDKNGTRPFSHQGKKRRPQEDTYLRISENVYRCPKRVHDKEQNENVGENNPDVSLGDMKKGQKEKSL